MMLAKRYRGLQPDQISELFQGDSLSVGNRFFRILAHHQSNNPLQFAVLTPSKQHRSAVVRNALKRKVFAYLSQHFSDWTGGWRVAILVKTPAQLLDHEAFQAQLTKLLHLLREKNSEAPGM